MLKSPREDASKGNSSKLSAPPGTATKGVPAGMLTFRQQIGASPVPSPAGNLFGDKNAAQGGSLFAAAADVAKPKH